MYLIYIIEMFSSSNKKYKNEINKLNIKMIKNN